MEATSNQSQYPEIAEDAWRREPGPILLLAGPGTGKTHQLALRIRYLVEERAVSPETISVITFTREAAENMRRRIADQEKPDVFITPEKRPSRILTMHSIGLEIVRSNNALLGLPADFQVVTNAALRRVIFRDAAMLAGLGEIEGREADWVRQQGVVPSPESAVAAVIAIYERILRANHAIDYDDQIKLACQVLEKNAEVHAMFSSAAKHLLIDEYQDINYEQRKMIDLLSKDHPSGVFAVGDDDQSIYSFRGGSPKYIRQFREEFGGTSKVLTLAKSRRCPENVVMAGLSVVKRFDPKRLPKPNPVFASGTQDSPKVMVHDMATDEQEAQVISRLVSRMVPKKSVLILVPAKQYANAIKRELRARRIAYDHPLALDESGFVLIEMLHEWIQQPERNFPLRLSIEAICESGTLGIPNKRARTEENRKKRHEKLVEIAGLWNDVLTGSSSLWDALGKRIEENSLYRSLQEKLDALVRIDAKNVGEFLRLVAVEVKPWGTTNELIREVRGWLEELRTHQQIAEGGVRIMTLQAAKGLEADIVCVVGLNEGIIPRIDSTGDAVAETARLTYVSMTRAKAELHLFHARKRDASVTYLKESYQLKPSRFLEAVEAKHKTNTYHQAPSKLRSSKSKRSPARKDESGARR